MMAERYKDTPQVFATLELQIKAAVSPATTTDSTFAGPLATYGIAGEALELLRGTKTNPAFPPNTKAAQAPTQPQ
jgi:hypothetical protein